MHNGRASTPQAPEAASPRRCRHGKMHAGPGRKRALLIGCCYPNSETDHVRGACHDVECMRNLLCGLFRFRPEDVCMLVDVPTPSLPELRHETVPTRANILREMTRLVHGVQAGDSLFFHFSGAAPMHGPHALNSFVCMLVNCKARTCMYGCTQSSTLACLHMRDLGVVACNVMPAYLVCRGC